MWCLRILFKMGSFNKSETNLKLVTFLVIFSICMEEELLEASKAWWETTSIYQIYPMSYKDSNNDGTGDLNGIYEKLDYIKDLGVETIWIQPFYRSPMADLGYDVKDFYQIEPMFGTMDDFKRLLKGIHDRGMKLIMDFVPNHVSDEHEWFQKSIARIQPYADYFIWKDAVKDKTGNLTVPNNWLSIFGGSAWEWNDKRKQYYFKQFSPKQPDLNYRYTPVRKAVEDILKFWLDLGIDGFRMDATKHLMEDALFRDEPYLSPELIGSKKYMALNHTYTVDLDDSYELTHEWRLVLDAYKKKDGKERIMCTESYSYVSYLMKYFGNETYPNAHFPLYFGFILINHQTNSTLLNQLVHYWLDNLPENGVPNWQISNHDNPRAATRVPPEMIDALQMLQLMLPGVAGVYYGDEIGMQNTIIRKDQIKDPNNAGADNIETRDGERTPMQWDDSLNAGFTNVKIPWLPINPNYWYKNVKAQLIKPNSHLNIFKRLMALRKTKVIREGDVQTCVLGDWTYMFVRSLEEHNPIVVVMNLGFETEKICAQDCVQSLPPEMYVSVASQNSGYNSGEKFMIANTQKSTCSLLRPKAGLVLATSFNPSLSPSLLLLVLLITVHLYK